MFLKEGIVYGCGDNSRNRMGNISKMSYTDPAVISSGLGIATAIGVTQDGTYILTSSALYSAGLDDFGELSSG